VSYFSSFAKNKTITTVAVKLQNAEISNAMSKHLNKNPSKNNK
jgi:hypothetical protein